MANRSGIRKSDRAAGQPHFLEQLLDTLEPEERQLLQLRYVEEKTQSEVAKLLGTTQVQISRREKKLLAKLRNTV